MENKRNIVLAGYMGSGKTSVSKSLEWVTDLKFLDTDEEIANRAGKSISAIFADEGEAAFRSMETDLLQELIDTGWKGILSTGGGMPVKPENRELLKKLGMVVYLKATPEAICMRLENDTTRPLLAGLPSREAKLAKIREMLQNREKYYEEAADITVDTDGMMPREIADEIKKYLSAN